MPLRWIYYEDGSYVKTFIYNGEVWNEHFKKRHHISYDNYTGTGILAITDLQLNDSGRYICQEKYTAETQSNFYLTVLGI